MPTPSDQAGGTPRRRLRALRPYLSPRALSILAAVLVATTLHLARNGYAFGGATGSLLRISSSSDHSNVLPWVLRAAEPGLYPHDLAIAMGAGYPTPLWRAVGLASRAVPLEWLVFALYLAALAATHLVLFHLARSWGGGPAAGWLAVLAFTAVRAAPAGVDTFDPAFYSRVAALPLALGAWLLLGGGASGRSRPVAGFALLAGAFAIHALTGFYAAAVAVPLWLLQRQVPQRRRLGVLAVLAAALVGAPLLAAAVGAGGGVDLRLGPPSAAWVALQRSNNPMHLFPGGWGEGVWRELGACGLFLLPPVLGFGGAAGVRRRRAAVAAVAGGLGLALLGGLAAATLASQLALQLQPFRGMKLVLIAALAMGAGAAADGWRRGGPARLAGVVAAAGLIAGQPHLTAIGFGLVTVIVFGWGEPSPCGEVRAVGWRRFRPRRGPGGPAVVGLAAAAAVVVLTWLVAAGAPWVPRMPLSRAAAGELVYTAPRDWPFRPLPRGNPWIDVQLWCERNTDRRAYFLTPPDLEGFRTFSRRSHFIDWKEGTLSLYHEAFGMKWLGRMRRLVPRQLNPQSMVNLALNYDALAPEGFRNLVLQFGFTHVVVREPRELPHPLVYRNGVFRVYATGLEPFDPTDTATSSDPPPGE